MGSFVNNLLGTKGATAALPAIQQQNLLPQIENANQMVNTNIASQNAFAEALKTQMGGGGPNLAGAQLANATGQNVANQAALMASQRGTGSNAGLIARQAATAGGNIQQQAAGQAAAERQAEELNSEQLLGSTYGNIGQQAGQNLGTLQSAQSAQNNAIVGGTTATNKINADVANQQNQNGLAGISGIAQALPGVANTVGGLFKSSPASGASNIASSGAGGGLGDVMGAVPGMAMLAAEGGEIKRSYSSEMSNHLKELSDIYHPHMDMYAKGGKVDALVSPGEQILKPKDVKKVAEGKANPMSVGGKVPGNAKVPGAVDSYKNDTEPKKLEVNSIVIPRHITQGKNPGKDASAFVMAIINKKKVKK